MPKTACAQIALIGNADDDLAGHPV